MESHHIKSSSKPVITLSTTMHYNIFKINWSLFKRYWWINIFRHCDWKAKPFKWAPFYPYL